MSKQDHLLIVDDDPEIRQLLADYLRDAGYQTSTACDGKEMRRRLELNVIDLIVLDLMLPGEDGLSLCRDLRTISNIPVIMLTARGSLIDRIVGLEIGADDYLPKTFDPRELLVRIKVVLRRVQSFLSVPGSMRCRSCASMAGNSIPGRARCCPLRVWSSLWATPITACYACCCSTPTGH